MQSQTPASVNGDTSNDLPTIVPPSGKFIARLFLVPGLIVTVAVLSLLLVVWWVKGESSPEKFLERLDSPNPDQRWRGASDLAQVLLRDQKLASDPRF